MKTTLLVLCIIFSISLLHSQTYKDGSYYFENSDKKLNQIYNELININKSDTIFIKNLRISQRAWLQFRDAQLTLMYPTHSPVDKRDLLSNNELKYLAYLTDNRTKVLDELLSPSTTKRLYVSDLEIINQGKIHGGIGLDKPYWADEIVICGKKYGKGIVMHPEAGGIVAYAEFLIPKNGGRLLGVAGWAGGGGSDYISYHGRMRYRIFVDGKLLYGNEIIGKECRGIDLQLGSGKVLRIETENEMDNNYSDHMAFGDLRIEY